MAMTEEKDLEQKILEGNPDTEPAEDDGVEIPIESEEGAEAETEAEAEAEAETETESGEEPEEEAGKKKEGLFGKKKKKDKKDEQIEELNDKLKRQMAEFDNFRKRSEKEKSQMFDMGARTIIEKVLPVVDNFERGLAAVPEEQKEDAFVTGMDKVYKQLMTELDAIGVKAIEAVGQEFDPELHNAVMQVENEELESGTVAQELQKGYTYKETVVRHSMVAVVS
jgi:molecular chaperone GrpE